MILLYYVSILNTVKNVEELKALILQEWELIGLDFAETLVETQKSGDVFEQAFRDYFAGGANTVEAAMNELKQLKQGNKKMVVFGQELREVARRADIHADRMLIGYLKSAVNSEMTPAIIYRGHTTYTKDVNICIEVENDLIRNLAKKTSYTPAYANVPVAPPQEGVVQNFQKKNVRDRNRNLSGCDIHERISPLINMSIYVNDVMANLTL
ncbi:hypothetical protein BD560DRAFT_440654 [Blakeslea trispora]|nr:hypothetical protein BD560DRAFT_440654 [Blakeslea trispora]